MALCSRRGGPGASLPGPTAIIPAPWWHSDAAPVPNDPGLSRLLAALLPCLIRCSQSESQVALEVNQIPSIGSLRPFAFATSIAFA